MIRSIYRSKDGYMLSADCWVGSDKELPPLLEAVEILTDRKTIILHFRADGRTLERVATLHQQENF